jgi:outer membrane lipoprotein-sorting protein
MIRIFLSLAAIFLFALAFVPAMPPPNAEIPDPELILKECIKNHGGWKNFTAVKDMYAKMVVFTFPNEGKVQSTFRAYYRKPDKLRIEIDPPKPEPSVIIGWDGKYFWQLAQGQLEKTDKQEQIERIQEGLRFIKLMILTNLLQEGSVLKYEGYKKGKATDFHIISQSDPQGEKVSLYISTSFTLLGAEFYLKSTETLLKVFLSYAEEDKKEGELYLPKEAKLYKEKKMVMEVTLTLVKINSLQNGNSFFSDLTEKVNLKKIHTHYRREK